MIKIVAFVRVSMHQGATVVGFGIENNRCRQFDWHHAVRWPLRCRVFHKHEVKQCLASIAGVSDFPRAVKYSF